MRLRRAEAHGAEDAADVRRVVLLQALLRQRAVIDEPLQAEHAGDVGLRFLEAGVGRADGLADVDALPAAPRERRPEAVGDLVHHHGGEIALRRNVRGLVRTH